jgi:nicotinamidase-related amidase
MTATAFHLLLIDAQNDFCDLPGPARPALPVAGADADLHRVAALVRQAGDALDAITLTLDSHHRLDIAHPGFWWADRTGTEVAPFTPITAAAVRAGQFRPRDPAALPRTLDYLDALEAQGRYTLMVWPVHCEVGTWGHQLHGAVRDACAEWEVRRQRTSHVVFKGLNPWTEHYSALQAEVPDPADPDTGLNHALIHRLDAAERLLIAGEAGSHCVRATVEHLVANLPDPTPERLSRLTLLTDAISPVGGFEAQQAAFFADMRQRGVRLATCAEVIDEMLDKMKA